VVAESWRSRLVHAGQRGAQDDAQIEPGERPERDAGGGDHANGERPLCPPW
jgi:hypothetical protein